MTFDLAFLFRFLSITILDLTLAGDNAVVIGMAIRSLPERQRKWGLLWGAFGAVALRVACTFVAAQLLLIPLLQFGGGLLLLWIAWKLLQNPPGAEASVHGQAATRLLDAVKIIILADFVMSLDNMLAVAAASHGSFALLAFGLGLSIPIILCCSALVAMMMNRWPWLVVVGAAILGWVSGEMLVADKVVSPQLARLGQAVHVVVPVVLTAAFILLGVLKERARRVALDVAPARSPDARDGRPGRALAWLRRA
jgi:YjbE family integral membrane protein